MEFVKGSVQHIDTVFPDNFRYFELLAMLVDKECAELFNPLDHSTGIEKGKPFQPDARMQALLSEAARLGEATVLSHADTFQFESLYLDCNLLGAPTGIP